MECSFYTMRKCCPSVRNIFAKLSVITRSEFGRLSSHTLSVSYSAHVYACVSGPPCARAPVHTAATVGRPACNACAISFTSIPRVGGVMLRMPCRHAGPAPLERLRLPRHACGLSETATTHVPVPPLASLALPTLSPCRFFFRLWEWKKEHVPSPWTDPG